MPSAREDTVPSDRRWRLASAPRARPAADVALAWLVIALGVALRVAYVLHHRVNSDEPQHLHVAWAVGAGQLMYRDVFDNHAPIFSMLMAPLVRALGERPDIVIVMRWAMLPLVAVALGATWWIARRLWSSRAGWWAVAIAAICPGFLPASVEYRTDQLWMALWLVSLAVLVSGSFTRGRAFLGGVLLGTTLSASMKTSLLLVALLAAGVGVALMIRARARVSLGILASRLALLLAGFALVPLLCAAYFAQRGAGSELVYCVARHNVVPGLGMWETAPSRPAAFFVALPLLWLGARQVWRTARTPDLGARRALVLLTAGVYVTALNCFWPLVTAQDSLPSIPMVAALGVPLVVPVDRPARAGWRVMLVVVVQLAMVLTAESPWPSHARRQVDALQEVLRLSRPGESVMDLRGEAIFRPRPFYYALEAVTQARILRGLIREDIPARLISTRTLVVLSDSDQFPTTTRRFLHENYLGPGPWRIAGKVLDCAASGATRRLEFRIAIPAWYALVGAGGAGHGWLDDEPYRGPRFLAAGRHAYVPGQGETRMQLASALELARGFALSRP